MEHNPKDEQVFETYWRGLDKDDALVSFKAQMELLPKIWIIGQFVPALIFASYLSVKFFGSLNFYKIYVENAVILVFALVTNISFFKRTWEDRKKKRMLRSPPWLPTTLPPGPVTGRLTVQVDTVAPPWLEYILQMVTAWTMLQGVHPCRYFWSRHMVCLPLKAGPLEKHFSEHGLLQKSLSLPVIETSTGYSIEQLIFKL